MRIEQTSPATPRQRRFLLWFSLLFLVLGCWTTWTTATFLARSTRTTGTIVQLNAKTDAKGKTSWTPVFTYRSADGRQWTITSRVASSPPEFVVGQSIPVRYEPSNPSDGHIDSLIHLWMLPFGMFLFAAITFAMHRAKNLLVTRWRKVSAGQNKAAE